MKNWIALPLAAILGIVAGSWGPREDLKLLKEQRAEAASVKRASDSSGFGAFAKMVNIPDVAKRPAKPPKPRKPSADKAAAPTNPPPDAADNPANEQAEQSEQAAPPRQRPRLSREDLRARIDEAAELWRTRVELAKTQWKSKLGIVDKQKSATFDNAINAMNESLLETMTALADEISKVEKVTPELGLRLMGDASRVMAEAYDAIGEAVPPERRGEVSELPVFEFIDPSVAEPLIGVQDKLDATQWRGPHK